MRKKKKILRLGATCLSLLMMTALLMVGGSFSKHTSTGDITGIPSLTVAGLDESDIEVKPEEWEFGDVIDNQHVTLYAFTITNKSDVPVTCGLDFWAHIEKAGSLDYDLTDTKVLICDEERGESDPLAEASLTTVKENADINVFTEESGEEIFVEASGATTCKIVLELGDSDTHILSDTLCISPGDHDGEHTNAVTLTVEQAETEETY